MVKKKRKERELAQNFYVDNRAGVSLALESSETSVCLVADSVEEMQELVSLVYGFDNVRKALGAYNVKIGKNGKRILKEEE